MGLLSLNTGVIGRDDGDVSSLCERHCSARSSLSVCGAD